jgi:hypothetical protein
MDPPAVGDVVLIPFPYSDLSQAKRRPALVISGVAGRLNHLKMSEVLDVLVAILRRCGLEQ